MAVSIDTREADEVLRDEWARVLADDEPDYLNGEEAIKSEIHRLIHDDRYGVMTFKYMFLSAVLAKATHSNVHYKAVKTTSDLDGAFSSRTVAEQVIVDWEQENGERLGGSNEPGTSKPYRWDEFSSTYSDEVLRSDVYDRLTNLLGRLQSETESGDIDPVDVLRYTLYEISQLDSQTLDITVTTAVPYHEIAPLTREYLEITGGGERLAAVAAGVVRAYYFHAGDGDWEVNADHVNVPDQQSNAAGDIEVMKDDELRMAFEVKDKPVARNDIQNSVRKAKEHELGEYLYLVGSGFADGEEQAAKDEAVDAEVEMVLLYPDEFISQLKFVGKDGRQQFVNSVTEFLNDMRAQERNKEDWFEVAEQFDV